MKHFNPKTVKILLFVSIVLLATSCYDITEVRQPATATPGSEIEVTIKVEKTDAQSAGGTLNALAGVMLPNDWNISNVNSSTYSVWYNGAVASSGVLAVDNSYTTLCNDNLTTAAGYNWIGLKSTVTSYFYSSSLDSITCTLHIQVSSNAAGDYQLQYVVGDNYNELNPDNTSSNSKFFKSSTTTSISSSSLQLEYPNATTVPLLNISTSTEIQQVDISNNIIRYEYFDMNGKKLKEKPAKGFYIEQGIRENGTRTSRTMGAF